MAQLFDKETKPVDSITGPQLPEGSIAQVFSVGSTGLTKPMPFTYKTARKMRKSPTIALARSVFVAPIAAGEWGVELKDEETADEMADRVTFVKEEIVDRRQDLIETALFGIIDYGWAAFEKVFKLRTDGLIGYSKVKPLLADLTSILIESDTGAFAGFAQSFRSKHIRVPLENSFLIPFQVEGTNWYGRGLLENALDPWQKWSDANDGASKYDAKVAGSHWVVYYPAKKQSKDPNTKEIKSNFKIAIGILNSLEANGKVVIPSEVAGVAGWKVELLTDKGKGQASFVQRLEYLDRQMFRSFLMPERTAMEGRFGTRAEAETHVDVAITTMELVDKHITRLVNWYLLDPLLALNWGDDARGSISVTSTPLADVKRDVIKELYDLILKSPEGFAEELPTLDTDAMKDLLGIPTKEPEEFDGDIPGAKLPPIVTDEDKEREVAIAASLKALKRISVK